MGLQISEVDESNLHEWQEYIRHRKDSTFTDTWEWRTIVRKAYNLDQYWFLVKNNNKVEGCVALTLTDHPLFGRYLATAPFGSFGGFYFENNEAFTLLIEKVQGVKQSLDAKYVLIRKYDDREPPVGWVNDTIYSSYMIELPDNLQHYSQKYLSRKTRACVRNCKKHGFYISYGREELLDDFWYVILRAMKELGSPYHSRYYLETLLNIFGTKAKINIIYSKDDYPCSAGLSIIHNNQVDFLYGPKLDKFRSLNIGELLYWSIIEESFKNGFQKINLGRSLIGSGNEQFKFKWRPNVHKLAYWYNLSPGEKLPRLNQSNRNFNFAIKTWSKLPIWATRRLGPKLISGIL